MAFHDRGDLRTAGASMVIATLNVIRRMAALVAAGVPASEAAEVARVEGAAPDRIAAPERAEDPLVGRIAQAASRYDETGLLAAIRQAYARGWSAALDEVLFPALRKIGENWGDGSIVSANEHFATEVIRREISTAISSLPVNRDKNGAGVLLACPEGERHDLGLSGTRPTAAGKRGRDDLPGGRGPAERSGPRGFGPRTASGLPVGDVANEPDFDAPVDASADIGAVERAALRRRAGGHGIERIGGHSGGPASIVVVGGGRCLDERWRRGDSAAVTQPSLRGV